MAGLDLDVVYGGLMSHLADAIVLRNSTDQVALAVQGVSVEAHVDGPLVRMRTLVRFKNDLPQVVEGDLVFPLPPFASLVGLTVLNGGRTIQGTIKPRAQANAQYQDALNQGATAALGETEGEDLARLRIAPIAPGADVEVTLILRHLLLPTLDGSRLIIPLTYMPRFVEDAPLKATEQAALDRPRPLTLAARASVEIRLAWSGNQEPSVRSTAHSVEVKTEDGTTIVRASALPLDRDFQLDIADRGKESSVWLAHDSSAGPDRHGPTTALVLSPAANADEGPTLARTLTYLVDRSGSMGGGPMEAAIRAVRGCLRALGSSDRFNILAFDDSLEAFAPEPVAFDDANLKSADAFLEGINARGGTQASMALTAALEDKGATAADPRLRIIVFMTDGDVADAENVLKGAKDRLAHVRLHVLGIGDSVNHAMLAELARLGGGTYTPVSTDEDLERALTKLKNAIDAPLLTNLRIAIENNGQRRPLADLEPEGALDLFAGEPLRLAWRGPLEAGDVVVVEGERVGRGRFVLQTPIDASARDDEGASILWALLRNRRLGYRFDPSDDTALEELGTTFGVVNRAVSLVGVDPKAPRLSIEGSVPVVLPLSRSVVNAPATAAPSPPMYMAAAGPVAFAALPAPPAAAATVPQPVWARLRSMGAPIMDAIAAMRPSPAPSPAPAPPPMSPAPGAFPTPAVFAKRKAAAAPVMAAPRREAVQEEACDEPPVDNEGGLRSLLLRQGADGLFDGDLAVTLVVLAALVVRGHNAREGLFRAELKRTLTTLRKRLASLRGTELTLAEGCLELLGLPVGDRQKASEVVAARQNLWVTHPAANAVAQAFGLVTR
jgi:Ca-activated chloride channel family protein